MEQPVYRASARQVTVKIRALALCTTLFLLALPLHGQDYPSKPVTIVVPAAAGGGLDRVARLLSERLRIKWGQPVVVANRAGAAGIIGSEFVAKSAPDGYTLLFAAPGQLVINKLLYARLAYDPDGFVPISLVTTAPNVLVVHPSVAAETVQQLVALAKAHPDKLSYASQGVGTSQHLSPELLKSLTGISIVHVPYKGGAPALADLVGGQVDIMFTEISGVLPLIRSGKLRALAVGSARRTASLPNVPAISEVFPGFVTLSWQGMAAPPGTPAAIADAVSAAVAEALKQPEVAKQIAQSSLDSIGSTPSELAAFMKEERERWVKVIRATGARAE